MSIGSNITQLYKEKGWSQGELSTLIVDLREFIGIFELNEISLSFDMALNRPSCFWVMGDFLLDVGEFGAYDKEPVHLVRSIQKKNDRTYSILLNKINTYIHSFKVNQAFTIK